VDRQARLGLAVDVAEEVPAGYPRRPAQDDAAAIKAEENLDGKYLLRTSDPGLSAGTSPWATSSCWKCAAIWIRHAMPERGPHWLNLRCWA
jgi:hypothetical protein